jgi:hypothetical protein
VQRISALIAIIAMAIAIGAAFGRILQGHVPTYRLLAVGVTAGIIAWATERRGMLLATTVSVVGLSLALAWLLAPQTTWFGTPTLETVRTLGSLAEQVGSQARQYGSPAPATPPLILAGVVAVWASIFSCYALAFRAQSPILSLLPPLVLVAFADGVGRLEIACRRGSGETAGASGSRCWRPRSSRRWWSRASASTSGPICTRSTAMDGSSWLRSRRSGPS